MPRLARNSSHRCLTILPKKSEWNFFYLWINVFSNEISSYKFWYIDDASSTITFFRVFKCDHIFEASRKWLRFGFFQGGGDFKNSFGGWVQLRAIEKWFWEVSAVFRIVNFQILCCFTVRDSTLITNKIQNNEKVCLALWLLLIDKKKF